MSRLVPLLAFVALAVLLAFGLRNADHKSDLPSPLIGKAMPSFDLPTLLGPERRVTPADLRGQPWLVNFWASWCVTCRVEHPVITELANSGAIQVIGFNFRDEPDDARAWLSRFGDPYAMHLSDLDGRVSIDFGVYAAPESFLVDPQGTIVFKHIGALTEDVVQEEILPRVARMAGGS